MKLYNDDCLNVLKTLPDNSVDLVVTDCPYHIVSGGCSNGAYGNNKEPGSIFERHTKHQSLYGILKDDDPTTYAKQGKLFKHNDIEFSEWLPELYRIVKQNSHTYIYI